MDESTLHTEPTPDTESTFESVAFPVPAEESKPPKPEKQEPGQGNWPLTVFCAVFSAIALTVLLINLTAAAAKTDKESVFLALANRAFMGTAVLTPPETEAAPPVTDPPDEVTSPPDTDPPTDTEPLPEVYSIEAADLAGVGDIHTLFNETAYTPDTISLLDAPLFFLGVTEFWEQYGKDAPYILILHTHGTEAFAPEGADTYSVTDSFRSTDTSENIVAVGAVMAETFREAGISVIHCTEMFDKDSYRDSYNRAAEAIRAYLEEYPSIQIVLDVHRDSVIRADKTKIRPITEVGGETVAQFMTVVGTNERGGNHPLWDEHLSFALKLQENLAQYPRFARAISLRGATFNQQYTKGSLLLEVGSCGNTLNEAKRAAILAARGILEVIR